MPYKSEAQRRKFRHLEAEGKLPPGTAEEWEAKTPPGKLPERVAPAPKAQKGLPERVTTKKSKKKSRGK
jgi:hypothetical protein